MTEETKKFLEKKGQLIKIFMTLNELCRECHSGMLMSCKFDTWRQCIEYNLRLAYEIIEINNE